MEFFVDTSALIAILDELDPRGDEVRSFWRRAIERGDRLVSSNYVMLESVSIVQRRFGLAPVHLLCDKLAPELETHWIDADLHAEALRALRLSNRRTLSLVDCSSFVLMRELEMESALALDPHFAEQGFAVVPRADEIHESAPRYGSSEIVAAKSSSRRRKRTGSDSGK